MRSSLANISLFAAFLAGSAMALAQAPAAPASFPAVDPSELAMKDYAPFPGTGAVILEWNELQNDHAGIGEVYYRIKVLNENGKRQANVEIPYFNDFIKVDQIEARVVEANGTILPFTGKIFDKLLVKGKGFKIQAKTFTLPDVRPGCIVEYRYRVIWPSWFLHSARWELQQELPVKKASLRFVAGNPPGVWAKVHTVRLPQDAKLEQGSNNVSLELHDLPGLEEESFSPPDLELKPRVDFYYGAQEKTVAEITSSSDNNETKLKKIYDYLHKLKNLNFMPEKSAAEWKRENIKPNKNLEDLLKHGYGNRTEVNRALVSLARAAGMEAYPVWISTRDRMFFAKDLHDSEQLNSQVAIVRFGGKEQWLDVGTPFAPYGMLRWHRAGVQGMVMQPDHNGFVVTPEPKSADAATEEDITLKMTDTGLAATIIKSETGYEALEHRLESLLHDEQEVKQGWEDEMKAALPSGSTVKLRKISNLAGESEPLVTEYEVSLPDMSSVVGQRRLLPLAILESGRRNPFQHEKRNHPVYFHFPYQERETVKFELPEGYTVEKLPSARNEKCMFGNYTAEWTDDGKAIRLKREFAMDWFYIQPDNYSLLRDFYGKVTSADQESVILHTSIRPGN